MIYGIIEEMWVTQDQHNFISQHNEKIIEGLPINDAWPPLSKEMFSMTKNHFTRKPYLDDSGRLVQEGPYLDYSGRLIHFGANIKATEFPWIEWKQKMEGLLGQLYWQSAVVHWNIWWAESATFKWAVDSKLQYEYYPNRKFIPRNLWIYEGNDIWDEK